MDEISQFCTKLILEMQYLFSKKIATFVIGVATIVVDQDYDNCGWSYDNCGWRYDNCGLLRQLWLVLRQLWLIATIVNITTIVITSREWEMQTGDYEVPTHC